MKPDDWVADCMVPDAWLHQPFRVGKDAVACDGVALIAFVGLGAQYEPPKFDNDDVALKQIQSMLVVAEQAHTEPVEDVKALGLSEQHAARLAEVPVLMVAVEPARVIVHEIDERTGAVSAYGVIYKAAG
jgi:hypothetical protein